MDSGGPTREQLEREVADLRRQLAELTAAAAVEDKPIDQSTSDCYITNHKRGEKVLRASETLSNRTQAIAHDGSWELDLPDNRLTWSDEVYRIFGLRLQEFGASYAAFLEAVHPDDRAAVDDPGDERTLPVSKLRAPVAGDGHADGGNLHVGKGAAAGSGCEVGDLADLEGMGP